MVSRVGSRSLARRSVGAVSLMLVAGLLVAAPVASAEEDFEAPKSEGNKNSKEGDASAVAKALAKARSSKESVEVVFARTLNETLTANPDGSLTREIAQAPIRAKDETGDLVDIDPNLAESDGRLRPAATNEDVSFSADGSGDLARLELSGDRSVALSLAAVPGDAGRSAGAEDDLSAPKVDGSEALYTLRPDAAAKTTETPTPEPTDDEADGEADTSAAEDDSESIRLGAKDDGFSAHVILGQAPQEAPTYAFDVDVEGLTPALKNGTLLFSDADGKPVAQSAPLKMWDQTVDAAGDPANTADVDASLERTAAGWVLTLKPSMDYLTAESTKYPVTVDPDVSVVPAVMGDTYYADGADANTSFSSSERILVGADSGKRHRGFVSFAYNSYFGTTVTSATLRMKQYFATNCSPQETRYHSMTGGDNPSLTWNDQPDHTTDARYSKVASFNQGNANCAGALQSVDVTPIVNGWAGKHVGPHAKPKDEQDVYSNRQAIIMRAGNEYEGAQAKRFCSRHWNPANSSCAFASVVPRLALTYAPELGVQSWYSTTDHSFNDKSSLTVNNRNGNAVVQAGDIDVNGLGLNLNVSRTYNSQATVTNTTLGEGWGLSIGPDIWLEKKSAYRYDYHGPSGTVLGSFVRKSSDSGDASYKEFSAPIGGAGADLQEGSDGFFTLSFRKSQTKYVFGQIDTDGHAYMRKVRDRSDNEIELTYSGSVNGRPKLTTITDASSRPYAVTYTGNVITKIAEPTLPGVAARDWEYGYTSGKLTSFTDADSKTTTYAYHSGGDLRLITSPSTAPGGTETEILYAADQVTNVYYRYGSGGTDRYNYSWNYNAGAAADCNGNGNTSTIVTDPRANPTTYCYRKRDDTTGDIKTWVYDALDHEKSTEYNADNGPTNITAPTGTGAGGSTVVKYSNDLPDQVDKITEPKSSASNEAATTGMEYDTGASTPGSAYLPSAVRTSTNDCNRYGYDDKGRTNVAYSGITADSSESACGASGGASKEFHTEYNDNGTIDETWDANAEDSPGDSGNEPPTADKTVYTYYATSDPDYVAGTAGQVRNIRRPGGDCSAGASRKLCTTYTYDGAARVKTITDGRGTVTGYKYDNNNHTTRVYYNFTTETAAETSCLSTSKATCLTYDYDGEGNLTARGQSGSTTNFQHDRLNRMIGQSTANTPSGDYVGFGFDGVGNLIGTSQFAGGASSIYYVQYTYDSANRLDIVSHDDAPITSSSDHIDIDADADGQVQKIKYPAPTATAGLSVEFDYTKSGKPTSLTAKTHAGTQIGKVDYDYDITLLGQEIDTPQLQSRQVYSGSLPVGDQVGTTSYEYSDQRLQAATDSNGPNYEYDYDKVGNLEREANGGTTTHFGYNKAGELCWRGPTNDSDPARPPTTCGTTPTGNAALSRDAAGNSLGTTASPYTVNERNQVSNIDGLAQSYQDQGNDIRRSTGTAREVTGPLGIVALKQGSTYTYFVRDPSGTLLASNTGGTVSNYVSEPNGNISWIVSPSGTRTGAYKYAPYGETTAYGSPAETNRFRWLGAPQNTTSTGADGHYKLGARYYDDQAHFTQADPVAGGLGDPKTLTRYNYAGGDPVNSSDPSGYVSCDTLLGGLCGYGQSIFDAAEAFGEQLTHCISEAGGVAIGAIVGSKTIPVLGGIGAIPAAGAGFATTYVGCQATRALKGIGLP